MYHLSKGNRLVVTNTDGPVSSTFKGTSPAILLSYIENVYIPTLGTVALPENLNPPYGSFSTTFNKIVALHKAAAKG